MLTEVLILVGAIMVCMQIGFSFLRKAPGIVRTRVIIVMGILTVFLMLLAYATLLNAPILDFIDRCRPSGTGLCINGQSFEQVQNEVDKDHLRLFLFYVILPTSLCGGLQSIFLIRAQQKDKESLHQNPL
jgi:NADH:ubiquinone oxidoreductase subunit 6 (subunit J)